MSPSDPDETDRGIALATELHAALRGLKHRLRAQAGANDLTMAQKAVLIRLDRDGPATGSTLARAEGMRPQSMGAIIAALLASGHVVAQPDPTDGRKTIVSLAEDFRQWLHTARAVREDWLSQAVRTRLSAAERTQLADALPLLRRLAEP